jgi:hypothetical protein
MGAGDVGARNADTDTRPRAALDSTGLERAMTWLRSNADLALMAVALGVGSLAYASGAFVMGLALHPRGQQGWAGIEMIAVSLYPLGWIGLVWGGAELWARWHLKRGARG